MQAVPVAVAVGPDPIRTTCPNCRALVITDVSKEFGSKGYICCGLLMLFGCCLCAWIPCCMDSFHNTVHRCPQCRAFIGQYSA